MSPLSIARQLVWSLAVLRLMLVVSPLSEAFSTPTVETPTRQNWFPRRIQESIPYDNVVRSLFVRQIVTETKEMGIEAIKWVVSADTSEDVDVYNLHQSKCAGESLDSFGRISQIISVCSTTKKDGGKIGWVEPNSEDTILPVAVVQELYRRQPKAGDIELIHNEKSDQWHVLQVSEIWMDQHQVLRDWNTEEEGLHRIGSYGGKNQNYPKRTLKGRGVIPALPSDLRTYTIQTAGCQMNVADSERCKCWDKESNSHHVI